MSEARLEAPEHFDDLDGVAPPAATLELHGHRDAWRSFSDARRSGRLHHAWLMQGPRGIGKATAAFAMARRLLAGDAAEADPVFSAADPLVRQIAQGSHPNVAHITRPPVDRGTGFKSQITVEEIRRLNRFFHATTSAGQWRIAIIDPADDMNRSAANALLKILEEPPERSIFLITNHLPGRLLPTIRSRCRVLRFEPLPPEDLAAALAATGLTLSRAEIASAARMADGSVRTAISLLANGGIEIEQRLAGIWKERRANWNEIQSLADALTARGRETAYELLLAGLLASLARESEALLSHGDGEGAARIARLWQSESARFREAAAFNLDRKQVLLTFFSALFEARGAHSTR